MPKLSRALNDVIVVADASSVAPTTGTGKGAFWVGSGTPTRPQFTNSAGDTFGISSEEAATTTALAALPATSAPLAWVQTVQCYWRREPTSTLTPDGITVIAAIGGGNWERLVGTSSLEWLNQAAWYIDPVAGSDEATGAVGEALETLDELNRRLSVGPLRQNTTIHILAGAIIYGRLSVEGGVVVTVRGATTTLTTDTVAAYTQEDDAGNTSSTFEATGVTDWTPYNHDRIRFTSGPASGKTMWVTAVDPGGAGLDVARVSQPGAGTEPTTGNAFVVESLDTAVVYFELLSRDRNTAFAIESLVLSYGVVSVGLNTVGSQYTELSDWPYNAVLSGCLIQSGYMEPSGVCGDCLQEGDMGGGLYFDRCGFITNDTFTHGYATYAMCAFMAGAMIVRTPELVTFYRTLFDNNYLYVGNSVSARVQKKVVLDRVQLLASGSLNILGPAYVLCTGRLFGEMSTGGGAINLDGDPGGPLFFRWLSGARPTIVTLFGGPVLSTPFGSWVAWTDEPLILNGAQKGTGTLVAGTATISAKAANTRGVLVSRATTGGTLGYLSAPTGSRTASQFVVNSSSGTDTSTFDWFIPGGALELVVGQSNVTSAPYSPTW